MNLNLSEILLLMEKFTLENNSEIGEQEGETSTGGGEGYPTVTKWETGLTRGVANSIDDKETWKSLYKINRGKGNTLL